ncbi:hypothetical protein SMMN14_04696 [Sphaerulina musiva]
MRCTQLFLFATTLVGAIAGDLTYYADGLGEQDLFQVHLLSPAKITTRLNPGKNPYCGKKIAATLSATGKTVRVTIVDKCARCNDESLDFSGGAWGDIINRVAPFEGLRWHFPRCCSSPGRQHWDENSEESKSDFP